VHDAIPVRVDQSDDLSARARAWLFARDPRTLWPALDRSLLQPSADAIGRAVASLVRGESTTLGAAGGQDAYAIGIAALLTGTGPLLGRWVEQRSLDVSGALADVLARHLAHGRMRVERIAREVAPALSCLVRAGVTPTVIKGFHAAHCYFPEPGLRPISDVDVVVTPADIPQAEVALRAAGFTPSPLIPWPYKRDWYPPDDDGRLWSFELFDARDRWKLEVHDGANFGELPSFGLRLDTRLRSGTPWHASGVPIRAPAQPLLTAILATHLSAELHTRCLLRVVELLFVIRRDRELALLDWDAFDALLDESRARRFVYPALSLVEKLLPGTIDSGFLSHARHASTRLARVVTDRLTPTFPILDDRPILAERLMWIASGRDAVQSIANWVNPVRGAPWRQTLNLYHSRLARLVSGRASWIVKRGRS
jgi:putative nucleotidyltransferase-like protein